MENYIQEATQFVQNHLYLSLIWVVLLVAVIYFTMKPLFSKVKEINSAGAVALMNKDEAIIVDIRSNDTFKTAHIANSVNLLPVDIKNGSIQLLEKFKQKNVIIAYDVINTANEAAGNLVKAGFENVFILKDGIEGWNSANLPLVRKK